MRSPKRYELEGSGKIYVETTEEARMEFQLLMTFSPSIQASISKVLAIVLFCIDAGLTGGTALYCAFGSFHEL